MKSFSQRLGLEPVKSTIQIDSIDDNLRVGLWNVLTVNFFYGNPINMHELKHTVEKLFINLWLDFFKFRLDKFPIRTSPFLAVLEQHIFKSEWNKVYDLIECIAISIESDSYNGDELKNQFIQQCNYILEKEFSGFRFIDGVLAPIISDLEIKTIENVANSEDINNSVKKHVKRALQLFSDRENPDYRNSIKESISAVESYCTTLTGESKPKLSTALAKIETHHHLHPSLKEGFNKLYGYTSDESGIRHAIMDEKEISQEDALFMLISCSAFINYLQQKATKQ